MDRTGQDSPAQPVGGASQSQVVAEGAAPSQITPDGVSNTQGGEQMTASKAAVSGEEGRLSARSQEVLKKLGVSNTGDLQKFATVSEAVRAGIAEGQPVIIDGEVVVM